MKKMMVGLSLALSVTTISGQKTPAKNNSLTPYSYQTFNCDNKGYFDSAKYKKEEIDGVNKLLYQFNGVQFDTQPVFKLSNLEEIRKNREEYLQQLENQYQEKKKELYSLEVINLPMWKKLQQETIQSFENEYQLNKEEIIAYSDPSSLKDSKFYGSCKEHIDAISSPDREKMFTAWKNYIELKSKSNADPKAVLARFNAKLNDPQKEDYALIDMIGLSFHNCANSSFRQKREEEGVAYKDFDKLFIKLKRTCDEP
ncbi:hypothetical protein C1637_13090 [Chryseobacterium lactis]|uniref:Uncharacterized protein n=1 Tax=Chryseobacterium lactis TaxID=1241981 RepID=A0A3G6RQL0_CHRLC|nr:hypothetical protein [Chryseobacterium lactis]AZA85234.1 hypothetical protein EG342_19475 [Chryseobacterium lactis]AZB07182.1 hypothetical protein EG341_10350 [Chryseobacterium lactis]PNW13255.1 hypothetical protein C1637_13090 [Chryseobacterium lactis]